MIKPFNETLKENSQLKLEKKYFSVAKVTSSQPEVDERLLTTEAIDLMLMDCERQLIKLNHKTVKKKAQPIDTPRHNEILSTNHKDLSLSNRLKSAIKRYRYQAELHPDSAIVQTNLGRLYHKNRQWQEAIRCYQKAIAIDNNYSPARQYLMEITNR